MKFRVIKIGFGVVLCLVFIVSTSFVYRTNREALTNREFIYKVFESISKVKTLRYHLNVNERIKGSMLHSESFVKLQISPRKLYMSLKGPEVLWIQGVNNGDALVNPGAFPYINFNLDPYGSLMRKDQHHTIHEMGFQYMVDILKDRMEEEGEKAEKCFSINGEEKFDGRMCYKVTISYPDFAWGNYTVKNGENLTTIARKLHLSEYMLLENNPKASWYNDVKEGQVIKVPNAYAKLTLLLIDKEYLLPVSNKIFDDKGLFEMYDYFDLKVNSPIAPEEFTKNYQGYHF